MFKKSYNLLSTVHIINFFFFFFILNFQVFYCWREGIVAFIWPLMNSDFSKVNSFLSLSHSFSLCLFGLTFHGCWRGRSGIVKEERVLNFHFTSRCQPGTFVNSVVTLLVVLVAFSSRIGASSVTSGMTF